METELQKGKNGMLISFQILLLEKLIKMSDGQKVGDKDNYVEKKESKKWKGSEVYQGEYQNESVEQSFSPDLK